MIKMTKPIFVNSITIDENKFHLVTWYKNGDDDLSAGNIDKIDS